MLPENRQAPRPKGAVVAESKVGFPGAGGRAGTFAKAGFATYGLDAATAGSVFLTVTPPLTIIFFGMEVVSI